MPRKRFFKKSGVFHVYILQCRDGSYYTGYTNDLAKRLLLHKSGKGARYTRSHGPCKLVWTRRFSYYRNAFKEESRIKRMSRSQKEKLVKGKRKTRKA
jgi:putative endonuclease